MIDLIVFPYRDQYFSSRYGDAVRDLHIISALETNPKVGQILVVNRPTSIYERILGTRRKSSLRPRRSTVWDVTSPDLLGPTKTRRWTISCYSRYLDSIAKALPVSRARRVVLDFTPMAQIEYQKLDCDFVWYDVIDDFTKHNRYSDAERAAVAKKYRSLPGTADLVTAVTDRALTTVQHPNGLAIPNGLVRSAPPPHSGCPRYTFGFIGFVTDKFDVEMMRRLVDGTGRTIGIFGAILDREIGRRLKSLPNVTLEGPFSQIQIGDIMTQFQIGVVPYRWSHDHGGSPIKLYQYLSFGRPVLLSHRFPDEVDGTEEFCRLASADQADATDAIVSQWLSALEFAPDQFRARVRSMLPDNVWWDIKLDAVLSAL